MWELDGWDGLVRNFEVETAGGRDQDPSLAEWWAVAATLRRGGFDRILVPDESNRSIDELCAAGVRGEVYCPRARAAAARHVAPTFVEAVRRRGRVTRSSAFAELLGVWDVAGVQRRRGGRAVGAAVLGGVGRPRAGVAAVAQPVRQVAERARSTSAPTSQRTALVDAELSPMRIGRQPAVSDRRPLDQV